MNYKEKPFVSIVVYLHNASKYMDNFLKQINRVIESKFESFEYIMVDDFSEDGTYEKAMEIAKAMKINVSIIRLARKHNKELALLSGADKSVGDYSFEFETPIIDYPLEMISDMFYKIKSGYDVVTLESTKRLFSSRLFYYLFNKFSQFDYDIYSGRVSLISRRASNAILNINEKIRSKKALLSLAGFSKTTIKFKPINNDYKDTRRFFEKLQIATEFLVSYSNIGTMFPIFLSVIFIIFSVCMSIFALCTWISLSGMTRGWTSIMILISICFGGVFFILGILSEYIVKILKESINIPLYTIKEQYSNRDS